MVSSLRKSSLRKSRNACKVERASSNRCPYDANEETNTYGGVYLWQDRQAMLDYKASEIFNKVSTNPKFTNVTATDFELLAGPSKVTGIG